MYHSVVNVTLRIEGKVDAEIDVWFLPGLGKSQLCFREAFNHSIARAVRLITFDLPGLGSSPARDEGLAVADCAKLWCDLILNVSSSRHVVLVAHSMAGIIATETAKLLDRLPALVVSVEGNLTLADATTLVKQCDMKHVKRSMQRSCNLSPNSQARARFLLAICVA
jgi:pimeloyl-ACP methyl ester carboxylesterase